MNRKLVTLLLVAGLGLGLAAANFVNPRSEPGGTSGPSEPSGTSEFLPQALPALSVRLWAAAAGARTLAPSKDGKFLFVGTRADVVYKITLNGSEASKVETFQQNIAGANGLCFVGDDLYLAKRAEVVRYRGDHGFPLGDKGEVVLSGLPDFPQHGWRYLKLGPDGRLWLAIGAPCNVCEHPEDERLGSICSFTPEGKDFRVEAHGVRNSVGFDWRPGSGDFYFSDNGRDGLGDDIPPCELNLLPQGQSGKHYGFPYRWGTNQPDPDFGDKASKIDFTPPLVEFQAHVAPLGCYLPRHPRWKGLLPGQVLVAQHGSWDRSSKVGYQVVCVDLESPERPVTPFLFGFLDGDRKDTLGRPVDLGELADGTLLVSDDQNGKNLGGQLHKVGNCPPMEMTSGVLS